MKTMTIDDLTTTVRILQEEVKDIKEINNVLINKLDKAYEDRIVLRSQVLKSKVSKESEVENA
jgi:FtsZ-binding cell division protein ZapB|tara:strand:- start:1051 stop:1239 length:189 start_codon:yes stop_codon:yes gene_type:complete